MSRNDMTRLAEHADEFAKKAQTADDIETRDAYAVLAAVVRDEPVPQDVARRVYDRATEDQ